MGQNNQPVLKQPKLNFTAKPDGPYGVTLTARRPSSDTSSTYPHSTTLAPTSPLLPPTSPPLTTKPTTDPDRLTGARSKMKNSPPHEKDFEITIDRLEKRCDNLKEELESKFDSIKEDFEDWKVYTAGLIVDKTNDCMDKNWDTKIELDAKLNKTNASIDELIDSVNQIKNDFDGIRNHFELLNSRLDICEERVGTIEKGCEPVKT